MKHPQKNKDWGSSSITVELFYKNANDSPLSWYENFTVESVTKTNQQRKTDSRLRMNLAVQESRGQGWTQSFRTMSALLYFKTDNQ